MTNKKVDGFKLKLPRDEHFIFLENELFAFVIWLIRIYHQEDSGLTFIKDDESHIYRDGQTVRFTSRKGALAIGNIPTLLNKIAGMDVGYHMPSEMSIPERTLNSVRYNGNVLGYFDANNASIFPVGLMLNRKTNTYEIVEGTEVENLWKKKPGARWSFPAPSYMVK